MPRKLGKMDEMNPKDMKDGNYDRKYWQLKNFIGLNPTI